MNIQQRLLESEELVFRSAVDVSASHLLIQEYHRRLRNQEIQKPRAMARDVDAVSSHVGLPTDVCLHAPPGTLFDSDAA
jgi:hypothetical protein